MGEVGREGDKKAERDDCQLYLLQVCGKVQVHGTGIWVKLCRDQNSTFSLYLKNVHEILVCTLS